VKTKKRAGGLFARRMFSLLIPKALVWIVWKKCGADFVAQNSRVAIKAKTKVRVRFKMAQVH